MRRSLAVVAIGWLAVATAAGQFEVACIKECESANRPAGAVPGLRNFSRQTHPQLHRETTQVLVYALTVAKRGLKLQRVEEGSCTPINLDRDLAPGAPGQAGRDICGTGGFSEKPPNTTMNMHAITLDDFAKKLAGVVGRPVIDKTAIEGMFDFHLRFSSDETSVDAASDVAPSIFTAVQEQLGLKLEQARGPGESLVIDQLERPSEN